MLIAFLVALVGGYALVVAGLAWLAARAAPMNTALPDGLAPSVVVVVAARNEEEHLPRCLTALLAQDYPSDRMEIIVANDHSTDATAEVVERYARRSVQEAVPGDAKDPPAPCEPGLRCIPVPDPVDHLCGKAQALHTAIEDSDAELILVTDADCAPPPTWIAATATRFSNPAIGLVCGFSRIAPRPEHGFDHVQATDWAFMLGAISTLAEAGAPATGMGNNMAFRRSVYEAVGGYPALPFSVTEDFTLLRAVATQTPFRVRFPLDEATTLDTLPVDGWRAAYRQRQRWARGGLVGDLWVLATYGALFLVHLAVLVGLALAPILTLGLLATKVSAEAALLRVTARRTGTRLRLRDLPAFEAFLFTYMLTLPAVLLLRPAIHWKDRQH